MGEKEKSKAKNLAAKLAARNKAMAAMAHKLSRLKKDSMEHKKAKAAKESAAKARAAKVRAAKARAAKARAAKTKADFARNASKKIRAANSAIRHARNTLSPLSSMIRKERAEKIKK